MTLAAQLMQLPHLMLLRMPDHLVLDRVDLVADRLDRREIAVDDRIDQRVGEIVGLARPQAVGIAGLDALAHRD